MEILICDDDKLMSDILLAVLKKNGWKNIHVAKSGEECINAISHNTRLLLLDLSLPLMNGFDVLQHVVKNFKQCKVIIITAELKPEIVVKAIKNGAYNYITKPINYNEFEKLLNNFKQDCITENNHFSSECTEVNEIFRKIDKIADKNLSILLTGETGTGKEVFANYIHKKSKRAGPFIAVNCPAISSNLAESELFGHTKGSFTGADKNYKGKFLEADGGTLFLDEVADLDPTIQNKLLRVLQERVIVAVGSSKNQPIDIQIISATSKSITNLVNQGKFREDLYFRLQDVQFRIPPLRERLNDLNSLVEFFNIEFAHETKTTKKTFTSEVLQILLKYTWPGNVRELRSIIRRILAFSDHTEIGINDIDIRYFSTEKEALKNQNILSDIGNTLEDHEKSIILKTLQENNHNMLATAKSLNIGRTTLYRKLKKYKIAI